MQLRAPDTKNPGIRPGVIELPQNSDEMTLGYTPVDLTLDSITHVIRGTGTSVSWNIRFATTRDESGGAGTDVFGSDVTTSTLAGATETSFANGVIPAGNWLWLEVGLVTQGGGTVSEIAVIPFVAGLR